MGHRAKRAWNENRDKTKPVTIGGEGPKDTNIEIERIEIIK